MQIRCARIGREDRSLQGIVLRAPGPGWHPQAPALGEVFRRRADPGVDARLLRGLVAVVEIELVDELVERHGEVGWLCAGDLGDFGQGLGASHGSLWVYSVCKVAIVGFDHFAIKRLPFRHRVDILAPVLPQV
jgi:hypothetical protein